jgi:hypothetical protein
MVLVCHWTPPEGTNRSLAFKGGVINCSEPYRTGSCQWEQKTWVCKKGCRKHGLLRLWGWGDSAIGFPLTARFTLTFSDLPL